MDKFLIKNNKLEDKSVAEDNSNKGQNQPILSVSVVKTVQKDVQSTGTVRKCQDSYLNLRFTVSGHENHLVPECVVFGEKLSNECTALLNLLDI